MSRILVGVSLVAQDPLLAIATQHWKSLLSTGAGNTTLPTGDLSRQKTWDSPIVTESFQSLLSAAPDDYTRARLLAVSSPHAGDWLKALPVSSLGLRLDDEGVRISVGWRLGATICTPFPCSCGAQVDARGAHVLSCKHGAGRQVRHSLVNDVIVRSFRRAGIPCSKEPSGLVPGSALRPDGATIIPWSQGRCLAWDVTCPDTLAASYVAGSAGAAGYASEQATARKVQKYQSLASSHTFVPIAVETMGSLSRDSLSLLHALGGRLISAQEDPRERSFLFQRLSMTIQRGNIACFSGALLHCHNS